jgi:DNA-binding NarL/FixJ family response regulator
VWRALVVDPQPFFGDALAVALRLRGIDVVETTTDEREAERIATEGSIDVVLTELELSAGSGYRLIKRVHERTRALVLTRADEGAVLLDVVRAGAVGCVGHGASVDELHAALSAALEGGFGVVHRRLGEMLRVAASEAGRDPRGGTVTSLTAREREILTLVAQGLDNAAIGARLYLSADTVRTHVGRIMRKLGVHSRAAAARAAVSAGLVPTASRATRISGPDLTRT